MISIENKTNDITIDTKIINHLTIIININKKQPIISIKVRTIQKFKYRDRTSAMK